MRPRSATRASAKALVMPIYWSIVRTMLAACLLVLIATLPAIDLIYCPDGCAEAGRARSEWQSDVSPAGACGLCLNGVAVSIAPPSVMPVRRFQPGIVTFAISPASIFPRVIDQPPRSVRSVRL
jgi:hypothetical protein